jgi:hypothetical protein
VIDGQLQPWSDEVRVSMQRMKQGSVVALPPLFYAGDSRHPTWSLTSLADDEDDPEQIFQVHRDDGPPLGIILNQTCDLVREQQPWVQVAPVYQLQSVPSTLRGNAEHGRVLYMVPLTAEVLPAGGPWVADLRIEVPIEKGWFTERAVYEAFESEPEYLDFAERLAGRRSRPAVADVVINHVVEPLRRWLGTAEPSIYEPVSEVRLSVGGTRLTPERARLLVLTERDPLPPAPRGAWDGWWDESREPAADAGLTLVSNRYETLRTLPAIDYKESAPLDFEYLSEGVVA